VQPSEGQLGLGFHTRRPQHQHPAGRPGRMMEQRRLADPGSATHHQCTTTALPGAAQQRVDDPPLSLATV